MSTNLTSLLRKKSPRRKKKGEKFHRHSSSNEEEDDFYTLDGDSGDGEDGKGSRETGQEKASSKVIIVTEDSNLASEPFYDTFVTEEGTWDDTWDNIVIETLLSEAKDFAPSKRDGKKKKKKLVSGGKKSKSRHDKGRRGRERIKEGGREGPRDVLQTLRPKRLLSPVRRDKRDRSRADGLEEGATAADSSAFQGSEGAEEDEHVSTLRPRDNYRRTRRFPPLRTLSDEIAALDEAAAAASECSTVFEQLGTGMLSSSGMPVDHSDSVVLFGQEAREVLSHSAVDFLTDTVVLYLKETHRKIEEAGHVKDGDYDEAKQKEIKGKRQQDDEEGTQEYSEFSECNTEANYIVEKSDLTATASGTAETEQKKAAKEDSSPVALFNAVEKEAFRDALEGAGLLHYWSTLEENEVVSFEHASCLLETDYNDMGLKLGAKRKLISMVQKEMDSRAAEEEEAKGNEGEPTEASTEEGSSSSAVHQKQEPEADNETHIPEESTSTFENSNDKTLILSFSLSEITAEEDEHRNQLRSRLAEAWETYVTPLLEEREREAMKKIEALQEQLVNANQRVQDHMDMIIELKATHDAVVTYTGMSAIMDDYKHGRRELAEFKMSKMRQSSFASISSVDNFASEREEEEGWVIGESVSRNREKTRGKEKVTEEKEEKETESSKDKEDKEAKTKKPSRDTKGKEKTRPPPSAKGGGEESNSSDAEKDDNNTGGGKPWTSQGRNNGTPVEKHAADIPKTESATKGKQTKSKKHQEQKKREAKNGNEKRVESIKERRKTERNKDDKEETKEKHQGTIASAEQRAVTRETDKRTTPDSPDTSKETAKEKVGEMELLERIREEKKQRLERRLQERRKRFLEREKLKAQANLEQAQKEKGEDEENNS